MRTTIQWAWSARSKATAVGHCWLPFKVCQGATYETAPITTQKNTRPAKIVRSIATEKSRPLKFGLASSAHLPTDSKPATSPGHDLPDQQDGEQRRMAEQRMKVGGGAMFRSGQSENDDQR